MRRLRGAGEPGGETSLANTVLLCGHHHRLVQEGGWTVEWWGGNGAGANGAGANGAGGEGAAANGIRGKGAFAKRRVPFRDPRGQVHAGRPPGPPPLPRAPVAALAAENRRRGADPGPLTAGARWRRERDIPDLVLFRALEAAL